MIVAGPVDRAWVAAGEPVRSAAAADAPALGTLEHYLWLPVLERRGGWARVASPLGDGWVRPMPEASAGEGPPLGDAPAPPHPLPGAAPDPDRLAAARGLLGVDGPAGRLGPYPLYTDAAAPALGSLDRTVGQVEAVYRRRYGRTPVGAPREAIVLFSAQAAYRAFQDLDEKLAGLPAGGHAGSGLVATWLGGRPRAEVAATLVHEIAHLLNRRALGPALPPWLEEGIADDLADGAVGPEGDLDPSRLGGAVARSEGRIDFYGPRAALHRLRDAERAGTAVPLERLTELDWEAFVRSPRRGLHYAEAAFLLRWLLAADDPALGAGLHAFLDDVAGGGPATGEALRRRLGRSWEALDAGLAAWVEAAAAGDDPAGTAVSRPAAGRPPPAR